MSSSRPARIAIFFGVLSILAIPAGGAASSFVSRVSLLEAIIIAVPTAFVLGLGGISASRRARYRLERSVERRGERTVRFGRLMVWIGLYFAVIGGLALGFYALLRAWS